MEAVTADEKIQTDWDDFDVQVWNEHVCRTPHVLIV